MSGIAGIIHFDGKPIEPGLIEKMTSAMAHRGRDGINHWVKGSVALGQCMLRTTPESLEEHQPLTNEDESLVLVMDGRLDNRDELGRVLRLNGMTPRTSNDASLVLCAYRLWGEDSPQHLLGDFAFSIWDNCHQKLFCARDHLGARPFYYVATSGFFAFSSEDEALLPLPRVCRGPNEDFIAHLLVPSFQSFSAGNTWLSDILSLTPASFLSVSIGGILRKNSYWHLQAGEERVYTSDQQCREAFLYVFSEAVRCRLRSLDTIAAMMSGGLDSASILATVKQLLPEMPDKEFNTYSAISDHPECCVESQCIHSLTKDLGTRAHFVSVPSFQGMVSVEDLIEVAWSKAHPVDNDILLPAMMCLAASRRGDHILLNGVAGDLTTHAPIRYQAELLRDGHWLRAWDECKSASYNNTYLRGYSFFWLFLLSSWTAYMPAGLKSLVSRVRREASPLSKTLINPSFARKLRLIERSRSETAQQAHTRPRNIREAHLHALYSPSGITSGLMGFGRVAGRYGVELRDPWADKRVVEFFLGLPLRYKVRDGWTKYLLRTAFAPNLDERVRWRLGKEHLGWTFKCRLMDEAHKRVCDTIEQGFDAVREYVDQNAFQDCYQRYKASRGNVERSQVYEIMTLILWVKRIANYAN